GPPNPKPSRDYLKPHSPEKEVSSEDMEHTGKDTVIAHPRVTVSVRGKLLFLHAAKGFGDGRELGEGSLQVLHDLGGDDLRRGQGISVVEPGVAHPGDVQVDLVAGQELFESECLEPLGLDPGRFGRAGFFSEKSTFAFTPPA